MAQLTFSTEGIETRKAFDPVPAGWYNVQIVASDMKDASTGGQYLEIDMEILDGEYASRHLFDRINLVNANPKAVEIGRQTLATICEALGIKSINDTVELHGKPMQAKVKVRPAEGEYDASNEVKGYRATGGAKPAPVNNAKPSGGKPNWA